MEGIFLLLRPDSDLNPDPVVLDWIRIRQKGSDPESDPDPGSIIEITVPRNLLDF